MHAVFCAPLRYTQGPDATQRLGAEIVGLGLSGPALVVTSPSPRKRLEPVWKATLGDAAIPFQVHGFAGECTDAEIARIVHAARECRAALVIGAGGGKVLDAARAAAGELEVPFISCPTIASTDAPCSAVSAIYDEEGHFLRAHLLPRNPDLVLVDSRVIMQSPPRTLVAGMGDALSTMFEARACVRAGKPHFRGGSATRAAVAMAELCYRTLLEDGVAALADAKAGRLTPALEHIIEANTLLSGLGFESAGLAAAHGVHNGLTAAPGAHEFMHGEKVAFGTLALLMLEESPGAMIDEVLGFCVSVGLPVTLAEIGCGDLSKEMLAKIAARATAPGEVTHNEPFPVTAAMVERAIVAADERGRAFLAGT
ncbi:MAG: glycerol dehydrogenase [Phycisphaerales bacterium]